MKIRASRASTGSRSTSWKSGQTSRRTLARAEGVEAKQIHECWVSQVPLRRLGKPEEFANLVVFLASERASYLSGVSIAVDGGFVKGVY